MAETTAAPAKSTRPAMTQMNVRMPQTLHDQGVSALAEIGYNPSEAVRALWRQAAKRGQSLAHVKALLDPEKPSAGSGKLAIAEEGRRAIDESFASFGFDAHGAPADYVPPTDAELRDMQAFDQLNGRCVWDA